MVPSYGPLETIQLLSETFLFAGVSFRVIWLPKLKCVPLYMIIFFTFYSDIVYLLYIVNRLENNK